MKKFALGTMYWMNSNFTEAEFETDCRHMKEDGYSLVRVIIWWELVEEKQGTFDFGYVDRFFRAAEKTGLRLMPTIGWYPPFWLRRQLDKLGKNNPGRYPSLQHDEVRLPLESFIKECVLRYRNSPALELWNVWNEPTLNAAKHKETLRQFIIWLKEKYPTYEDLKKGWRGEYPVLSLWMPHSMEELNEEWLDSAFRLGDVGRTSAIEYDYQRFCTDLLCKEIRFLSDEIKKYDTVHPTHTNLHCVNDNPAWIGRETFKAAEVTDTISCSIHQSNDNPRFRDIRFRKNFYDCGADRTWSWLKDGQAMVGELQAGTTDCHHAKYTPSPETVFYELWQAYATGLSGVLHWQFRGWRAGTFELGEFSLRAPADGRETRRSKAVRRFHNIFESNRELLLRAERKSAQIAILESHSDALYRQLQCLDHPRAPEIRTAHHDAIMGCYRALNEADFRVEFISEKTLDQGDLSRYKVLYIPEVAVITADSAAAIREFICNGGAVWADGRFAWLDEHMYLRKSIPGHGMADLFGFSEADFLAEPEQVTALTLQQKQVCGGVTRQLLELTDKSSPYAYYKDGTIAAAETKYGAGILRTWGISVAKPLAGADYPGNAEEITGFAVKCGVNADFATPDGISARVMYSEKEQIVVLHNFTEDEKSIALPPGCRALCGSEMRNNILTMKGGATETVVIPG